MRLFGRSTQVILAAAALLLSLVLAAPVANAATPAVWVGAPLNAQWSESAGCPDRFPSARCSLPQSHHTTYQGQWAVDLQGIGPAANDRQVRLYAAPQDGRTPVSARVEQVAPACASGSTTQGGYVVKVGLYTGSQRIGHVNYAHIQPAAATGQTINRWGTVLGTVGSYRPNDCWKGVHLHLEMGSQVGFSCYNKGWKPYQRMNATNFVGFVGGNFASARRQACP